jgi:hypothetical protein
MTISVIIGSTRQGRFSEKTGDVERVAGRQPLRDVLAEAPKSPSAGSGKDA